jgi:heptosyltransferase I
LKRILIVRLSAIGDVVMASAILPALRQTYPDAQITWLVEPVAAPLLEGHPLIYRVLRWPRQQWLAQLRAGQWLSVWRAFRVLQQTLRDAHFDVAIDLQGLLKSGVWAWLSGAPTRIGLRSKEGSQYLMTQTIPRSNTRTLRISADYHRAAEHLGLDLNAFDLSLAPTRQAIAEAQTRRAQHGIHGAYLVIAPFTTRPQKHWRDEHWRTLLQQINQTWALPVIMLGGPSDQPHAAQLAQAMPQVHNWVGLTSLPQTLALISQAAGLIGVDTGLTHMGIAQRIPTVALFGSTRPYLDTTRPNATVLYDGLTCSPCRRHPTCAGRFDCMAQLVPARALTALQRAMEQR